MRAVAAGEPQRRVSFSSARRSPRRCASFLDVRSGCLSIAPRELVGRQAGPFTSRSTTLAAADAISPRNNARAVSHLVTERFRMTWITCLPTWM